MEEYHNSSTVENNPKDQPIPLRRWRPGQSVPPRNSGVEPDAWQALRRHAEAHAAQNAPLPFRTRNSRPADVAADRRVAA